VTKPRRMRWIGLFAVASASLLSGCYYYPYGYNPWGYPYAYPTAPGYPYAAGYPYPPAPGAVPPNPEQPAVGAPQPLNPPVQRAPLPPAPVPQ
jgi:hypothetical protein